MKFLTAILLLLVTGPAFSQDSIPVREDSLMIFSDPESPAQFPGGEIAMRKYIEAHLIYPKEAVEKGIEGRCWIDCEITVEGKVINVKVARGVPDCPQCDAEAVRIVMGMPDWKPATIFDKIVHSYYHIPVMFRLPE